MRDPYSVLGVSPNATDEEIKKACDKHEVEIDVSISHVKDNAISTVVVKVNKE